MTVTAACGRPPRGARDVGPLPDAVVFDLDGTLVDTESISEAVLTQVLGELGHVVTADDLVEVRGHAFAWMRGWLWERFRVDAQRYRALAGPAWKRHMATGVPTFPDARALLDELWDLRIPLAVCTSSGRGHLDEVLDQLGITHRFVATVSATEVSRHKPDPMPYARAVDLLGVAPAATVAIEDTVIGATAAAAAGLRVVGRSHHGMLDLAGVAHHQVDHLDLAAVQSVLAPRSAA